MSDGGSTEETVRALLDPCSEANLITLNLARRLNYKLQHIKVGITGVAGSVMDSARYRTTAYFIDPTTAHPRAVEAFVLRAINIKTPAGLPHSRLGRLKSSLQLADPHFDKPQKIDVVFGADVYKSALLNGLRRFNSLLAQQTIFGWTVTGTVDGAATNSVLARATCATLLDAEPELCHEKLLGLVQRFWALEEVPQVRRVSAADLEWEELYSSRVHREADGRYVVPLLIDRGKIGLVGDGLGQARAALASTNRRMQKDCEMRDSYCSFMEQYEKLGHMRLLTPQELAEHSGPFHYVSHHGIWQRSDDGRKFRVVFNASRPTDSGYCLNDALYSGPKLQTDIAAVVTLWRRHRFAFGADIKMMFRQIKIDPRDIHFLRILWSPSAEIPAQHYVLLTVTYGTASAPFLALRTIKQLCIYEGARFPKAVEVVEKGLYVDDFLSGGPDLESAKHLLSQLTGLLTAGGFVLKKWVANDPALLAEISENDRLRPSWKNFSTEGPVNELGIAWDPVADPDQFKFRLPPDKMGPGITKRRALGELARVFDPAGWLAPMILVGKLLIQDFWRARLDWDESLPQSWSDKWLAFRASLRCLSDFAIPRWFGYTPTVSVQLHVFSDASRRAMAGVLYCRVEDGDRNCLTTLVCAKTKLNSIRGLLPPSKPNRMTIPRLELRGAVIAARLLKSSATSLNIPMSSCHLWSDSRIVLHWVQSSGPVGNELVDNYVAHIQELASGATWHHVPSESNPADIASRGADGAKLVKHSLWWRGPEWLSQPEEAWPSVSSTVGVADRSATCPEPPVAQSSDLELQRLLREAALDWGLVESELAKEGISWKFIPPAAPHFGGLWEAGVKSMKLHLRRVIGPRRLTFEELSTLLVSIEMSLNSRPLLPPSGDLEDLEALTPSHFLIGTSATSYPQPSCPEGQLDRATHWALVTAMRASFWERWSREYLNTLIQRPKWKTPRPNLNVGDFVVIVDPSLLRPDGRWPLGKITAVHPGSDGLVRVTTVRTAFGEYIRPIVKLAQLPLHDDGPVTQGAESQVPLSSGSFQERGGRDDWSDSSNAGSAQEIAAPFGLLSESETPEPTATRTTAREERRASRLSASARDRRAVLHH